MLDEFALHVSACFPFTDNDLSDVQDWNDENPHAETQICTENVSAQEDAEALGIFRTFRSSSANQREVGFV